MRVNKIRLHLTLAMLVLSGLLLAACGDSTTATSSTSTATISSGAAMTTASGAAMTTASSGASMTTAAAMTAGEKPNPFRIGLIPNQSPDTVKTQYASFKTYMEKELGVPVELFVANNYAGVVQAMVSDKLDMAYFGGLTYVQAKQQADVYPIVTEIDRLTNSKYYTSVIIVPADSPIKSVAEIKGKNMAFGDPSSTSGALYPTIMLDQAGVKISDLKNAKYTGGHDATALAVANGSVDAGGLEERILLRLEEQGKVDPTKVRIIQRSEPISGYPWVVRSKLDKAFVEKVTSVFLNIKDPELLKLLKAEGYTKVSDDDYKYIREQAQKFNVLAPKS